MAPALLALLLTVAPHVQEGDAQAFTSLIDPASGAVIADGRYAQSVRDGVLEIEARYDFPDGRTVVERASLRLQPRLEQQSWDWTERKGKALVRQYQVDFRSGKAQARRVDEHKEWKEDLHVTPGKTFAGIAFVSVIKSLREELRAGQKKELEAVAFTPKPRVAKVSVTRDNPQELRMAERSIQADAYNIHPEIPAIAKLFVKAPDQHVWLLAEGPAAFLRYEGPLAEPGDPLVRVDLIPSGSPNAGRRARRAR